MESRTRIRELQHRIYAANEHKIRELVAAPSRFARADLDTYEIELDESVPLEWRPSTPKVLRAAIRKARVILVGDYHTLKQSQRGFLRILRTIRSGHLMIALEFVAARHQKVVDDYVAGRITDDVFLRRIEYVRNWPSYQVWPNFRPIFEYARHRGARILAVDADPMQCTSVFARDCFVAWRLAEALREYPHHRLAILIGEAHLAPKHLPQQLQSAATRLGIEPGILTIHQNLDRVYLALADRGIEDMMDVVMLTPERFVLPASSPIVAQQSFLEAMAGEHSAIRSGDRAALKREFARYVNSLARVLGLPRRNILDEVTVCGQTDLEELTRAVGFMGEEVWRLVSDHIASGESLCLPEQKIVYLASLVPTHMAEEAAHYLKARLAGGGTPQDPMDYFYSRVLHEAIGYFGAKVFNPKRKPPRMRTMKEDALRALFEPAEDNISPDLLLAVHVAAWHRARQWRKGFAPALLDRYLVENGFAGGLSDLGPDVMRPLIHYLGYYLGEQLFCAWRDGQVSPKVPRKLFLTDFEAPGVAFEIYHDLAMGLRSIRLPARF